jgi:hypothetical protein
VSARRLVVRKQPVEGSPPWRAFLIDRADLDRGHVPVGRFDDHGEAIRTGCTALRFVEAGIPWRVQS